MLYARNYILAAEGDWSDYILWWPSKQIWLAKPRQTLYAYGIQADAKLEFVAQHRQVQVELPDRKQYSVRVNFAVSVFQVVMDLCREFKMRHPEELSLMRSAMDSEKFAKHTGVKKLGKKAREQRGATPMSDTASIDSGDILGGNPTDSPRTRKKQLPKIALQGATSEETDQPNIHSFAAATFLGEAPDGGFFSEKVCRTVQERCYLNGLWLDSARSLYEQDIQKHHLLYLRFKYHSIMDLDPRVDEVRISQLYEQAKWAVLTEDVDCTEEEAYSFAALQFQVKLSEQQPQNKSQKSGGTQQINDIDEAISNLQLTLGQKEEGTKTDDGPSLQLKGPIKYSKPTRLTLRGTKKHFFFLKGTTLTCYKDEAAFSSESPLEKYNLQGTEVTPDVDAAKNKYAINIGFPSSSADDAIRLTLEDAEDFSTWMAGIRMVSQGKPLSRAGYDTELQSVRSVIALQTKTKTSESSLEETLHPEDVLPPRILKKIKPKHMIRNILEARASILNLPLMDAKMRYIKNWMSLQDFGVSLFLVRFHRAKKDVSKTL
jgi:kindlin 2